MTIRRASSIAFALLAAACSSSETSGSGGTGEQPDSSVSADVSSEGSDAGATDAQSDTNSAADIALETSPSDAQPETSTGNDAIADAALPTGCTYAGIIEIEMSPTYVHPYYWWGDEWGAAMALEFGQCGYLNLQSDSAAKPSVGTMHFQGPHMDVTLTGSGPGGGPYDAPADAGPLYDPGDTLLVSAQGATLPAVPQFSIVVPTDTFTLTWPSCAASNCGSLDLTQDLTVTWTPTSGGAVSVELYSDISAAKPLLFCMFDATVGHGTVPKSAMTILQTGNVFFGAGFLFDGRADTGTWRMVVHGGVGGVSGDMTATN